MLCFANELTMIAECGEDLGNMLTKMNDSCKEYGMKIKEQN